MSAHSSNSQEAGAQPRTAEERERRRRLLVDCRQMLVDRMSVVIHDALAKMSDELTSLALQKVRADEQQALLEAVSLVRTSSQDIESKFRDAFGDVFERRLARTDKPQPEPVETEFDELRLVEDSVVDNELEVDRLVRRARSKLDPDEVLGMRARLADLAEREWFDESRHPASPEAIFEALRTALEALGSETSVKSALLDAFEPYVSANLNLVYSNVNERLKTHRILPRIRPRVQVLGAAGERGHVPILPPDAAASAGQSVVNEVAGSGQSGSPGSYASASAPESRDDAFERLARQLAGGDAGARSSAARLLSDPANFGVADLPMPSAEPPLLDAITALQPAQAQAARAPAALIDELGEQARAKGSALDQLTVEIVSLVFDYIYNDRRLVDTVKQQLLRLQVVAVKAALLDRSFFARRQHPMRRLIDAITDLATDPDSEIVGDAPLVTGLTELVDWVLEHFDRDLAIFEDALYRLDVLAMSESERRVVRLQEITRAAEREESLAVAQQEARSEVEARLDENIPGFVSDFLNRWWVEVLVATRMSAGETDPQWHQALRLCEHLLWSVAPKSAEEIARLASLLPALINGLLKGLALADPPPAEREAFFNELLAWHTESISQAKRASEANKPRSSAPIRLRDDGSVEFRRRTNVLAAQPAAEQADALRMLGPGESLLDGLERGCLLDFEDGEQTLRVKLAWISPSRKLYALSRYPDFARSLARSEFAAMLDAGQVRIAQDVSPLDRAIESLAESPDDALRREAA